jgi:hypothetical protein
LAFFAASMAAPLLRHGAAEGYDTRGPCGIVLDFRPKE